MISKIDYGHLTVHPDADLFPLMTGDDLAKLADDIKLNGVLEPIVVHKKTLIDGRNRWRAAKLAGRPCPERAYDGPTDEAGTLQYIISRNLARRHLTVSQRSALAAEFLPRLEEMARQRKVEAGKRAGKIAGRGRPKIGLAQKDANPIETDKSAAQAARAFGVSPRSVEKAKAVKRLQPVLFNEVKQGRMKLQKAVSKSTIRKQKTPDVSVYVGKLRRTVDAFLEREQKKWHGVLQFQDDLSDTTRGNLAEAMRSLIDSANTVETQG